MKRLALALLAVPLMVSIHSCGRSAESKADSPAVTETPTVAVSKAVYQDLSRSLVMTAEFVPYQEVDIMAKVAGYIKEIYVDVGDHVAEGQTLALLEIPELQDDLNRAKAGVDQAGAEVARAKDEISRAESARDIAHLSYQRLMNVEKQRAGLIAQQEIDDAHSRDLISEAQLAGARSSLNAAQQKVSVNQAEQAHVQTLLDYRKITAPFAGVITKRFADKGSMIQAGTASQTQAMPVVRLSQNGLLRLILPVPESAVPTVHVGQQVSVRVPTLNRSFPGRVERFADRVQMATRTMDTEVYVKNPELVLIPGMYAEVNLTTETHARALTVPVSAVDIDPATQDSGKVMAVNAEGWIEERAVALGLETAEAIEIRSGLREGDMVVVGNRAGLRAGEAVHAKLTSMTQAAP